MEEKEESNSEPRESQTNDDDVEILPCSSVRSSLVHFGEKPFFESSLIVNIGKSSVLFPPIEKNLTAGELLVHYEKNYDVFGLSRFEEKDVVFFCPISKACDQHNRICHGTIIQFLVACKGQSEKARKFWSTCPVRVVREKGNCIFAMAATDSWQKFTQMDSLYLNYVKGFFKGPKQEEFMRKFENEPLKTIRARAQMPSVVMEKIPESTPFLDETLIVTSYLYLSERYKKSQEFRETLMKYGYFMYDCPSLFYGVGGREKDLFLGKNVYGWILTVLRWSKNGELPTVDQKNAQFLSSLYLLACRGIVPQALFMGLLLVCNVLETVGSMCFVYDKITTVSRSEEESPAKRRRQPAVVDAAASRRSARPSRGRGKRKL